MSFLAPQAPKFLKSDTFLEDFFQKCVTFKNFGLKSVQSERSQNAINTINEGLAFFCQISKFRKLTQNLVTILHLSPDFHVKNVMKTWRSEYFS